MPTVVNGRSLGVAQNGAFTTANTDPIPGGRLWAPAARSWNDMRAAAIADGIPAEDFMPAGPNSSARSRSAQLYFWTHQPPPAAPPYTSNHGWGIAVDVKTKRAAAWIMTNGHRYGWSHDEGARVGEWWHYRYIGGYKPKPHKPDPLRILTPTEHRLVLELDKLRKQRRDPQRRKQIVAALTRERKKIYVAGQRTSWAQHHRRQRYRILLDRTKPRR